MAQTKPSPETQDLSDLKALIVRMRAGERRAISRAVTELERLSAAAPRLLEAMQPHLGHALVIGFTGPPGAGKSTLINAYTQHLRAEGKSIGIIAVDPSSPISGGAILGDRIRMTATLDDDGVFMRSLASRGHLGGLCPAAVRVIDALDAAGKDIVLLETVGTGQTDIDVAEVADVRVVITAPGLGDDIQAMKSGLLEIADVLVVNKADREGAERTLQHLKGALVPQARCARQGAGTESHRHDGGGHTSAGRRHRRDRSQGFGRRGPGAPPAPCALPDRTRRRRHGCRSHPLGQGKELDDLADAVLAGAILPTEAAAKLIGSK